MPSFLDKAKEVIAKNQDVLSALEELDRTGKLNKISYKTKVSFTIDEELFNKFRNYCKQNGINMLSQTILLKMIDGYYKR